LQAACGRRGPLTARRWVSLTLRWPGTLAVRARHILPPWHSGRPCKPKDSGCEPPLRERGPSLPLLTLTKWLRNLVATLTVRSSLRLSTRPSLCMSFARPSERPRSANEIAFASDVRTDARHDGGDMGQRARHAARFVLALSRAFGRRSRN
jgi:hypothetical protein